MVAVKRRSLMHTAILGVILVLSVLLAHHFRVLEPLEHLAWDRRAKYCQWFAKPPTDKLVHLDLDDRTLEAVGSWPWPRAKLADIINEIRRANPRAIALDIIYSEPQEVAFHPTPDGRLDRIDNDADLAASIQRSGNVLIGAAFAFGETSIVSELQKAMQFELHSDVNLTAEQVASRVAARGVTISASPVILEATFLRARRDAIYVRINELLADRELSFDQVAHELLKEQDSQVKTPMQRITEEQYGYVVAEREMRRLAWPHQKNLPAILKAEKIANVPIPVFTRAAGLTGFFDYSFLDGPIRSIPLVIEYRGRIYPQLALSLACRQLGVDPATVRITADEVVLPVPGEKDIVIPVHADYSSIAHGSVPMLADVPWFGTVQWETMYDFPRHAAPKQHVSMGSIWDVVQLRQRIVKNNSEAEDALFYILKYTIDDKDKEVLAELEAHPIPLDDDVKREAIGEALLARQKDAIELGQSDKFENLPVPDQKFLRAAMALRNSIEQNKAIRTQLKAQRTELASSLGGKSIMIGWTAAGNDQVPTSLHVRCPGIVVHGVLFNGILTNSFARRAPAGLTYVLILLVGLLSVTAATILPPLRALAVALGIAAVYLVINLVLLFAYYHVILNMTAVVAAIIVGWAGCSLMRFLIEASERARITRRFSTYVDPSLVSFVVEHPETDVFEGQVREMTVVFSDLAGFTTISEKLGEESVRLLNEYMECMVPVIRAGGAYLNKFLGDGIMFFYGAPKVSTTHAADAVRTALKLQQAMEDLNARLASRGLHGLSMRIGVATGKMVVGDAGSKDMHDYTVLGDTVNLAARLESANKATGTRILLSGRTVEMLNGEFLVRPIAKLQVKGKTEGIVTYEAVCLAKDATDKQREVARLDQCIFDAFANAQFQDCLTAIKDLEARSAPNKLTVMYRELCDRFLENGPGDDFNGQIVLESK